MDSSGLSNQTSTIKSMAINPEHHKTLNWIAGAIKKKGALHRNLGVPQGTKIPESKIKSAASKGGIIGKEARLAETLRGFKH